MLNLRRNKFQSKSNWLNKVHQSSTFYNKLFQLAILKFVAWQVEHGVVIRAKTLFNLQCNNVARQVERKCCPSYLACRLTRTSSSSQAFSADQYRAMLTPQVQAISSAKRETLTMAQQDAIKSVIDNDPDEEDPWGPDDDDDDDDDDCSGTCTQQTDPGSQFLPHSHVHYFIYKNVEAEIDPLRC